MSTNPGSTGSSPRTNSLTCSGVRVFHFTPLALAKALNFVGPLLVAADYLGHRQVAAWNHRIQEAPQRVACGPGCCRRAR
jgi:hypothetical protein